MRTTIEIKPEHRARLLELAAHRREKGFSSVVGEAIEAYLDTIDSRNRLCREALAVKGTLGTREAERLRRHVEEVRRFWR